MQDITDTVNNACMVRQCMGYNNFRTVGYCLYGTLLLRRCYFMSRTNQSSSSHRCLHRHQSPSIHSTVCYILLADLGGRAGVTVKNIPTREIIPLVYFHV